MEDQAARILGSEKARRMADDMLDEIRGRISRDPYARTFLLLEMQRILDVRALQRNGRNESYSVQHVYLLKWGMNIATAELLSNLPAPGIPFIASNLELKRSAESLLWEYGLIALLRRCSEMIRTGLMEIASEGDGEGLLFRATEKVHFQILDRLEEGAWMDFERDCTAGDSAPQGWTIVASESDDESISRVGAYWRRSEQRRPLSSMEDVKRIMSELVRPWETPHGVFLGYDADPDVDDYYMTIASIVLESIFAEGGIHPSTDLSGFTGADLTKVLMALIAIYQKHIDFCNIAYHKHPEIDVVDCFTLWGPRQELVDTIADAMNLDITVVDAILRCVSVSAADAEVLSTEATPVLPLLIDLGNGMVLRPLSGLVANPFCTFKTIAPWRGRNVANEISKYREGWLRKDLYSMFGGRRYICIDGGVVIKEGKRILTDIDAAIFDRTTGELALFQLKWQDYSTEDVRQRISRAKNLADDVDDWAGVVADWLTTKGPVGVAQALRLNPKRGQLPTSAFLFVLSRNVARTQGYGHPVKSEWLSSSTWPQFRRVRGALGPAPVVFSKMHELLRDEEGKAFEGYASADYSVRLKNGSTLRFAGLWYESSGAADSSGTSAAD